MAKAQKTEPAVNEPTTPDNLSFLNFGNDAANKMKANSGGWDWLENPAENVPLDLTMVTDFNDNHVIGFLQHFLEGKNNEGQPKKIGFTCIGATNGCLGCAVGDEPKQRVILPVLTKDGKRGIWGISKQVAGQLKSEESLADGHLRGNIIKVIRTGSGMQTKYSFRNTNRVDSRIDEPDFEMPNMLDFLFGLTVAKQTEMFESANIPVPSGEIDF